MGTTAPLIDKRNNADTAHGSDLSTASTTGNIGSDSWIGADAYEADDECNAQTIKFFKSVKWDILASIASDHRGGESCIYANKYSIGQFNLVRRLDFQDGVSWVVRVRLPPEATPASLEAYDSQRAFEIEVTSLMLFRTYTTIPVPELFAHNADPANEVGVAYMLLEYIHGTTAAELREIHGTAPATYGTPEQDHKFRKQMAKIQAEVLSFTFPLIGSLYYSEDKSSFYIGPSLETGKGPWKTSTDYYRDLADHRLKNAAARGVPRAKDSPAFALPVLLNHLMTIHSEEHTGPFRLINRDFGAHNILVDNDFNIVGVVDFDGVMAGPLEMAAQYPVLSCMTLEPPGVVQTNPHVLARIERTKPVLAGYKEWLGKYEAELGDGSAAVAGRLGSTSALVFLGLLRCAALSPSENEEWFTSALGMLREYAEGQANGN